MGAQLPISAVDVARAVAVILDDPAPRIGRDAQHQKRAACFARRVKRASRKYYSFRKA
jgi:hypothetical protein